MKFIITAILILSQLSSIAQEFHSLKQVLGLPEKDVSSISVTEIKDSTHPHKPSFDIVIFNAPKGMVAYQKPDSAFVILDSLGLIRTLFMYTNWDFVPCFKRKKP